MTKDLSQIKQEWEATKLNKVLNRFPERKEQFTTSSDIPLTRPLYEQRGDSTASGLSALG
ncbi:MAG: hypothetical protein GX613_16475 [Chloroflexi bacterium]|nr:hypothetical protein [Chloroflexota bacterium]